MLEPKFRAWDKVDKYMLYFTLAEAGEVKIVQRSDGSWEDIMTGHEMEVMQSLNLQDNHGKEFYVGDIRKGKYGYLWQILEPGFHEGPYCYRAKVLKPGGKTYPFDDSFLDTKYIGNIYENPDLILQGKAKG